MSHDMVGETQVMVFTSFLGNGRYRVDVRWDPAEYDAPSKLDFNVCNAKSHDHAAHVGFMKAAQELGVEYDFPEGLMSWRRKV